MPPIGPEVRPIKRFSLLIGRHILRELRSLSRGVVLWVVETGARWILQEVLGECNEFNAWLDQHIYNSCRDTWFPETCAWLLGFFGGGVAAFTYEDGFDGNGQCL